MQTSNPEAFAKVMAVVSPSIQSIGGISEFRPKRSSKKGRSILKEELSRTYHPIKLAATQQKMRTITTMIAITHPVLLFLGAVREVGEATGWTTGGTGGGCCPGPGGGLGWLAIAAGVTDGPGGGFI